MTDQSSARLGVQQLVNRVPPRLARALAVVSVVYFLGFLWTYTQGTIQRLFIPFQWEYFFTQRQIASGLYGKWFLYGDSVAALFVNWLVIIALIAGVYFAYFWIAGKQKAAPASAKD
ncbi:MAG: hypothetical protein KJ728_03685 [Alphaproteobacteria bacterium]|uniref:hypothetical protein n=1 Tax=Brevundimonas sp. TaxID=1871086 RepID=UPI00356AD13B|nr:hypothetical protein [Alphaproteobacteria bacterium]MBU1520506.1 hypothetical protein [Alphaproteobacteria bacterium]MBU2031596.1 hypothetical protein [Alphaproteobacteria bacterium]MBU2230029.1 hypothetical protein [Alphaproteobacteria bacterium]